MLTQKKCVFALVKLMLNFFFDEPKLPLIPKIKPSPNIKKLFFILAIVRMR